MVLVTPSWPRWRGWSPPTTRGPTGIVGVVADALGRAGIATTSLWASVPHYVSQSSSPKATLALVERCVRVLGTGVDVGKLRISSAAYELQINELVASDEDASAYVTRLEEQDAEAQAATRPTFPRRGRRPPHSRVRRTPGRRSGTLPQGTPHGLSRTDWGRRLTATGGRHRTWPWTARLGRRHGTVEPVANCAHGFPQSECLICQTLGSSPAKSKATKTKVASPPQAVAPMSNGRSSAAVLPESPKHRPPGEAAGWVRSGPSWSPSSSGACGVGIRRAPVGGLPYPRVCRHRPGGRMGRLQARPLQRPPGSLTGGY